MKIYPKSEELQPLVSIIMPIFNGDTGHILQALDSIKFQNYQNLECLIIDDSTKQENIEFIKNYCLNDSRFHYFGRYGVDGLGAALNYGLANCNGLFIARMDADDISIPSRITTQVAFLNDNPEVAIVGSDVILVDEKGIKFGKKVYAVDHKSIVKQFVYKNGMAHPTVMFRRTIVESGDLYDPLYRYCEDLELWLRLLNKGYIFSNIKQPLIFCRDSFKYSRVKNNWIYNFRARNKYFSLGIPSSYLSVTIALIHLVLPVTIRRLLFRMITKT